MDYSAVLVNLTPAQRQALDAHTKAVEDEACWYAYEFQDNHRLARATNTKERWAYRNARANGCCGFYDVVIPCPDGNLLYGFNYGH